MVNISRSYNNIFAVILFLAGFALLSWVSYEFVNRYRPHWIGRSPAPATALTVASDLQQMPAEYNVSTIIDAHIFGEPKVATKQIVEQAPATTLKVNLVGVLSSDDENFARALIRVGSKGTTSYAIGAQVKGTDAKIHRVESGRVILDRGGKYEMLAMVRKDVTKQITGQ